MNLLFICSRNQWRSPTAEKIFGEFHKTKSAGTASSARIKVTANLIQWANLIFVMEKRHKQILLQQFNEVLINKKIVILHIADEYQFMDEELIEMLKISVQPYLDNS